MIYLDSCALVKLIVTEQETPELLNFLSGREQEVVTSELALTEVIRVVRRSCYDSQRRLTTDKATLDQRLSVAANLLDRFDRIIVDTDTLFRAGMHADDPHLGSLDAIHLVCAVEAGPELASFVTYDKALARAATQAGLPVAQPGR